MIEAGAVLRAEALLLGLWGMLVSLQMLVDLPNWRDAGSLGWKLDRLRRQRPVMRRLRGLASTQRSLAGITVVRLAASVGLMVSPGALTLGVLVAAGLLLALRLGADGADKIALVVGSGAVLQALGLAHHQPALTLAGTAWIGGQLTIAYFAAGANKALLAPWRDGVALQAALSSYGFGQRWAALLVSRRAAVLALAWLVILAEVVFPLALLLPLPGLAVVLAGFFAFHIAIALVMGLNTYPWAFAAAYPSALLLSQWLRATLGLA